jgi:hypothetical protein
MSVPGPDEKSDVKYMPFRSEQLMQEKVFERLNSEVLTEQGGGKPPYADM